MTSTAASRITAAVLAGFMSFATVALAAGYAYPQAPAMQLASLQH